MPNSDTSGSMPVDGSPELVAVFRVLRSLLMPRHPSCARIRLAEFAASLPSRAPRGMRSARSAAHAGPCGSALREARTALANPCLEKSFSPGHGLAATPDLVYELQFSLISNFHFSKINGSDRQGALENSKCRCSGPFFDAAPALSRSGAFTVSSVAPEGAKEDVSLERR